MLLFLAACPKASTVPATPPAAAEPPVEATRTWACFASDDGTECSSSITECQSKAATWAEDEGEELAPECTLVAVAYCLSFHFHATGDGPPSCMSTLDECAVLRQYFVDRHEDVTPESTLSECLEMR